MARALMTGLLFAVALLPTAIMAKESKQERQVRELLSLSPETLISRIDISNDPLDPSITISTKGVIALTSKGLLSSATNENSFLRGFIDKKTGEVSVQIYHLAIYSARGWHFFERATYEAPDGLREVETTRAGSDVSCSKYGCTHYEDIIVPIDFDVLTQAAANYDPAAPMLGLRYRLFAKSGEKIDDALPINEIVAFVRVMESSRPR